MEKAKAKRVLWELSRLVNPEFMLPDIFSQLDDSNTHHFTSLVFGPADTPYADGAFIFDVVVPPEYPFKSPSVQLLTTDGGTVRFNPNLYNCGKVCLSILGTWSGPGWSPVLNFNTVLLSIQSLLTASPYLNEPGKTPDPPNEAAYSARVR